MIAEQQAMPSNSEQPTVAEVPFGSNEVRLSPRQCVVAGIILIGLFHFVPVLWQRIEPLQIGQDYRLPDRLGNDYWTYRRYCRRASAGNQTLVIGDSVMWGYYVAKDQTLVACLNRLAGDRRFVNLSVNGIEPAFMAGLIQYYGADVQEKDVLLHCNLLWMADQRRDLQTHKERPLSHPRLLPQFCAEIPCYKETVTGRLGVVVGRHVPFLAWASHLRVAYFGGDNLPDWTIDHPYENPLGAVTLELPSPDEPPEPKPEAKSWTARGMVPQSFPWVELDTSIQWRLFRRTLEILRRRGNRVFVLVGPFNEHMLTEASLRTYRKRKSQVASWLRENRVPCYVPPPLPSQSYADASHPLSAGYALLAEELFQSEPFERFQSAGKSDRPE